MRAYNAVQPRCPTLWVIYTTYPARFHTTSSSLTNRSVQELEDFCNPTTTNLGQSHEGRCSRSRSTVHSFVQLTACPLALLFPIHTDCEFMLKFTGRWLCRITHPQCSPQLEKFRRLRGQSSNIQIHISQPCRRTEN